MKTTREGKGTRPVDERYSTATVAPGRSSRAHQVYGDLQLRQVDEATASGEEAHEIATAGVQQAGGSLPHLATIQGSFGKHDVGAVHAHIGGQAESASAALGAQAFTLGNDVAFRAGPDLFTAAHEAAHVVQQRGGVQLKSGLGEVGDRYEQHADEVAHRVVRGESAESLLDTMASPAGGGRPAVQRLAGGGDVPMGRFDIAMTKVQDQATKNGEDGTVSFKASDKAPDCKSIRLSQIVKVTNLTDNKDQKWTGSLEADRDKMKTSEDSPDHTTRKGDTLEKIALKYYGDPNRHADIYNANKPKLADPDPKKELTAGLQLKIPKAVEANYFVDHLAQDARATPRTKDTDAEVPQDYVWPGEEQASTNQHGSKHGKTIVPASLEDFPGSGPSAALRFDFETVARSEDAGIYFGTIHWDFELKNKKVTNEAVSVMPGVSQTFTAAVDEFREFYNNPHTVMKGETLWAIAEKYYGDGSKYPLIAKANKKLVTDPDHIEPGWKLNIPKLP